MSANKDQFMISLPKDQLAQMDALSIVLGVSRAEVGRLMVAAMIPNMFRTNSIGIERLRSLGMARGMTLEQYVDSVRRGRTVSEMRSRVSMPSLEMLESGRDAAGREYVTTRIDN